MDREEVFKKRVSSCVTFEAFYRNTAGRSAPTREYPKPFGLPAAAFPAAHRGAFADAGFGARAAEERERGRRGPGGRGRGGGEEVAGEGCEGPGGMMM